MSSQELNDPAEQTQSNEKPFRPVDLARIGAWFLLAGFVSLILLFFNCVITMGTCSPGTGVDVLTGVALGGTGVGAVMLVSALVWTPFAGRSQRRNN